jgi:hypothetical protein
MMRPPALALVVSIGKMLLSKREQHYVSVDENQYARSTAADKR